MSSPPEPVRRGGRPRDHLPAHPAGSRPPAHDHRGAAGSARAGIQSRPDARAIAGDRSEAPPLRGMDAGDSSDGYRGRGGHATGFHCQPGRATGHRAPHARRARCCRDAASSARPSGFRGPRVSHGRRSLAPGTGRSARLYLGPTMADALLEVRDLRTYIYTRRGVVKAVDGATFSVRRGETLGIVGESGSGKSMTCLSILRLVPEPGGRIVGGSVVFDGEELLAKSPEEMRRLRGSRIAMILQDPMASLNPALSVGEQIAETLSLHRGLRGRALDERVVELLRQVRISDPERRVKAYPHQMSGGIRQRVAGAIAISCQPSLLIADEPTTSLDVTIQAQYLRLLKDLQRTTNLAMVFVTHDLGIVAKLCDRVAVMYAGRIV